MRVVLEDYGHYATGRKPREGEDALLILDEFSALAPRAWTRPSTWPSGSATSASRSSSPPKRRRPGRPPPGAPAAGLLRRRDRGPAVPRPRAAAGAGRAGAGAGAQLGAGLLRPPRLRQGPDGGAAPDRPRGRPPGPARRGLGHPGRPVHPPAGPATAGRGAGAGRAGGHPPAGRRHHPAARSRSRRRSGSPPPSPSPAGWCVGSASGSAGGGSAAGGCPRRPGGRGCPCGPCQDGDGDESLRPESGVLATQPTGTTTHAHHRWPRAGTGLACGAARGNPCTRARTGRLPAGRAATWPPPASRALRYSLRSVPRVPAGPPAAALDPAVVQAARRDPVARGGRGAAPDQQARR